MSFKHRGFTLIELLVVISIIGLLISILLPSLGAARDKGRETVCAAALRGTGVAIYVYGNDYKARYPISADYNYQNYNGGQSPFDAKVQIGRTVNTYYTGLVPGFQNLGSGARWNWMFGLYGYQTDPKAYLCPATNNTTWGYTYGYSAGVAPTILDAASATTLTSLMSAYSSSRTYAAGDATAYYYNKPKLPDYWASNPVSGYYSIGIDNSVYNLFAFPRMNEEPYAYNKILVADSITGAKFDNVTTFRYANGTYGNPYLHVGVNQTYAPITSTLGLDARHNQNLSVNSLMIGGSVQSISTSNKFAFGNISQTEATSYAPSTPADADWGDTIYSWYNVYSPSFQ